MATAISDSAQRPAPEAARPNRSIKTNPAKVNEAAADARQYLQNEWITNAWR